MSLKFNYPANTRVFKTQRTLQTRVQLLSGKLQPLHMFLISLLKKELFHLALYSSDSMNDYRQTLSGPEQLAALLRRNLALICVTGLSEVTH